jgi:hypothetical protein
MLSVTQAYERLGLLYLGREYDLERRVRLDDPVLYESKDLVTHAVCVGMTGSGKTGLGIIAMEEAAIDGIPVLAIDVKGDLANLLLTFPNLSPAEFASWTEGRDGVDDAARWKTGLAEWGQDGERIARLKAAARVRVYTPGSRAGTPLSILKSLGVTAGDEPEDAAAGATSVAGSLLALAGVADADPHSREQTLIAAILAQSGRQGAADLSWLIQQIQRPAFDRVGVLDLETFYPARDRQALALRFNSVLATPGFDLWTSGDPLDVGRMLYTGAGEPRIAIVSVAHLDDAERMTAVSMVLNAVLEWTRRQSGTSSLRALIYMDEVFGYLPPVANPPSKLPLLTLLKQARAAGVGVMLATQNPVDLDYKALSNTGTWFLGKLQTERDKARVLDGLEGLGGTLTRQELDRALSSLRSRVFLMHNVHEQAPVVFETRWTLSYLRGPMMRDELRRAIAAAVPAPPPAPDRIPHAAPDVASTTPRPVLPAGIAEYFLPGGAPTATSYRPVLYGSARVHYTDGRRGVDVTADINATTPLVAGPIAADWDRAAGTTITPDDLEPAPADADAAFAPLPSAAMNPKQYAAWADGFEQWVLRARPLQMYSAPSLALHSRPDEPEADFRIRVQQAAHEARDEAIAKLRARYAPKVARAADKLRRAGETVTREEQQAGSQKLQTAVSLGATLVGALMGRKAVSLSTLGRATTAARGVGRSMKEKEDVARARERQSEAEVELKAIEAELEREVDDMSVSASGIKIDTVTIAPKRGSVDVRLVALAWSPSDSATAPTRRS